VRPREDDESFTAGERLPMRICLGEMAYKKAMLALIFDDQRKVGCHGARARQLARSRTEERCERISPHSFKKDATVVNLIEFG
jgi:hypothetical protein